MWRTAMYFEVDRLAKYAHLMEFVKIIGAQTFTTM